MAHSFRSHRFHLVWSTKNRQPWITRDVQTRLYEVIGGIVRNNKGILLEAGGMPDHIHLLLELGVLDKFTYLIRDMKAYSSGWVHKTFNHLAAFAWQEGYGSFSVSHSVTPKVGAYIQNQEQHHKNRTFEEEYIKLLQVHDVPYNPKYVFD
ncbi:MAG: IS200/IS605 family transposase [Chlamydiales bacterium]|nr:IS200/IS605 family transposase [Chlamydiales bacterium]